MAKKTTNTPKAYLNNVSNQMIFEQTNGTTGKKFLNISFSCPLSKNGLAKITISPARVFVSKRKDDSIVEGFKNVNLGDPNKTRKIRVAKVWNAKTEKGFKTIEVTNAQIKEWFDEARAAYAKSTGATTGATAMMAPAVI